jgi:hypothetical protein
MQLLKTILINNLKRNRCFLIIIFLLSISLICIQLSKQPRYSYNNDLFKLNYRNYIVDNYEDYEFDNDKKIKNKSLNINYAEKPNVNIFNLSAPLQPSELYESIQCTDSMIYIVKTTLCVHDIKVDMHVSGTILARGAWEAHILSIFILNINSLVLITFMFCYNLKCHF